MVKRVPLYLFFCVFPGIKVVLADCPLTIKNSFLAHGYTTYWPGRQANYLLTREASLKNLLTLKRMAHHFFKGLTDCVIKTVPSVYTLLMNTIYLSHSTQVQRIIKKKTGFRSNKSRHIISSLKTHFFKNRHVSCGNTRYYWHWVLSFVRSSFL